MSDLEFEIGIEVYSQSTLDAAKNLGALQKALLDASETFDAYAAKQEASDRRHLDKASATFDAYTAKQERAEAASLERRFAQLEKDEAKREKLAAASASKARLSTAKYEIGRAQNIESDLDKWQKGQAQAIPPTLDKTTSSALRAGATMWVLRRSLGDATQGLLAFGGAMRKGDLSGAVSGLSVAASGLAQSLDLLEPGLGAVTGAAVRLGGGIASGLIGVMGSLIRRTMDVVQANREMKASFDALGGEGGATLGLVNELSDHLPVSTKQIAAWTREFQAMGITDIDQLRHQVNSVAGAFAIMGKDTGAAESFLNITRRVQEAIEGGGTFKMDDRAIRSQLFKTGADLAEVAQRMDTGTYSAKTLEAALKSGMDPNIAQDFGNALSRSLEMRGAKPLLEEFKGLDVILDSVEKQFRKLIGGVNTAPLIDSLTSMVADMADPNTVKMMTAFMDSTISGLSHIVDRIHEIGKSALAQWFLEGGKAPDLGGWLDQTATGLERIGTALKFMWDYGGKFAFDVATGPMRLAAAALTADYGGGGGAGGSPAMLGRAPANAAGGLIERPAPGEFFASVAPGERILPAGASGGGVQIGTLNLHIEAKDGVTDAQDLSIMGLTLAFERLQLAGGR